MILFLDLRSNNVVLKAIPFTQIGRKKFYRIAIILKYRLNNRNYPLSPNELEYGGCFF